MPPISTNLADHGYVTEELIQHYAARAKGGVGLIISEVVTVEPTYIYLPIMDGIYKVLSWVVSVMLPPMAIFFPLFTICLPVNCILSFICFDLTF